MWYAFTPTHQLLLGKEQEDIAIGCGTCQYPSVKILENGIAVLDGDTHISSWVELEGRLDHDQNSLPIILEHINEGDVVVDAGAFIGDHTIAYLEKVKAAGCVFAFEPNPKAFQCLIHNCPMAKAFNYGLCSHAGEAFLELCENVGASSIGEVGKAIKLMCLDELNLDRLDFIKLDVEGYELKALRGAEGLIDTYRPTMWIEINKGALEKQGAIPKDIFTFLLDYGYEIKMFPEEGGDQYDILCTIQKAEIST
jgi:FkbM family methyltransferase